MRRRDFVLGMGIGLALVGSRPSRARAGACVERQRERELRLLTPLDRELPTDGGFVFEEVVDGRELGGGVVAAPSPIPFAALTHLVARLPDREPETIALERHPLPGLVRLAPARPLEPGLYELAGTGRSIEVADVGAVRIPRPRLSAVRGARRSSSGVGSLGTPPSGAGSLGIVDLELSRRLPEDAAGLVVTNATTGQTRFFVGRGPGYALYSEGGRCSPSFGLPVTAGDRVHAKTLDLWGRASAESAAVRAR